MILSLRSYCLVYLGTGGKVEPSLEVLKARLGQGSYCGLIPVYRIVSLLIFAGLYASTAACLWFSLACIKSESVGYLPSSTYRKSDPLVVCSPKVLNSWISNDIVIIPDQTLSAYLRSLHFVMQTLFTVGFGDIWPVSSEEFGFALVMIMISSLFCISNLQYHKSVGKSQGNNQEVPKGSRPAETLSKSAAMP